MSKGKNLTNSVIDLASIANAVAALECGRGKGWRQWTAWDKYALGQVTLSLLLYGRIQITSRGEKRGGAMGDVLRILSQPDPWQVATTSSLTEAEEEKAIAITRQRIIDEEGIIRLGLDKLLADSNSTTALRRCCLSSNCGRAVRIPAEAIAQFIDASSRCHALADLDIP